MNAMLLQNCGCAEKIMKLASNMEAATNCKDVEIAKAVCCAIVSITAIVVIGVLIWKLIDKISNGISGWNKRNWDVEDKVRKQKADLLDKKLDALSKDTKAYTTAIDNAIECLSDSCTKADKKKQKK